MILMEEIFASLEEWGQYPVMTEITPGHPEHSLNSDQFRQRVEELALTLSKMGVTERTPVPLFLENSIDFPTTFLALNKLNAIPVMVKMEYRQVELTEIFRNLDPDIIICEKNHLSVIAPWLSEKSVIVRDRGSFTLAQIGNLPCRSINVPEDVASINYTYRGYGYPLGSMATNSQYLRGADIFQTKLLSEPGEKMLVILPMSHIFTLIGCVVAPLMHKLTAVVAKSMNPRHLFEIIGKNSIEHILSIPEFYELLSRVHREDLNLESLKVFVSGGSYLSPEKYKEYGQKFGVEVIHGYGLTEFTPASSNKRGETLPGTIGPICQGIGSVIKDGEILLETPFASRGYYKHERETAEVFNNGYLRTGDLGHFENNHLIFDGEKKRTRKKNGNIVDLTEVENVITSYPNIDRYRLEYDAGNLTSYVSFRGNNETEKDSIRNYMKDRVAMYKIPRFVVGEKI